MYFDPYVLGFIFGVLFTMSGIFLILMISAIISVNKENKKK